MLPWVQLVWGRPWCRLPDFVHSVFIPGPPEHPTGSKGAVIRAAWLRFRGRAPGAVFLDGDVAVDACDVAAVEAAVAVDPAGVWAAACRMWDQDGPESYQRDAGPDPDVWRENPDARLLPDGRVEVRRRPTGAFSHRVTEGGWARWGRGDDDVISHFGLGCTYLPFALCECAEELEAWPHIVFPDDDLILSRVAAEAGIPARLVPGIEVKHLHWDAETVADLGQPARAGVR